MSPRQYLRLLAGPKIGASPVEAARSVVLSGISGFFRDGPGLSLSRTDARLVDLGIRPLTADADDWDARVRARALEHWVTMALEAQGIDALTLVRLLWPGARHHFGPVPGNALAGFLGQTQSDAYRPSAASLRARQQLKANAAALSLEARPVPGWCKRGHQLTDDNKSGEHCRRCRNATYRAKRAGISIDAALQREEESRHAA